MSQYPTGAAVLAEARLRLDKLPPERAVAILEGRDDFLVFCDRTVTIDALVVSGNKGKLMEALRGATESDRRRMVFVADCDYDVPAGFSPTDPNLVLTENPEVETDLIGLGLLKPVILEYVPAARTSEQDLARIADDVLTKSVAVAEVVGRLRQLSKVDCLGLNFEDLRLRRFRDKASGSCDVRRVTGAIIQRTSGCEMHPEALSERAAGIAGGLKVCHGADLVESIAVVLHQDYRRTRQELAHLGRLLRARLDAEQFETWKVAQRLRTWQSDRNLQLLR